MKIAVLGAGLMASAIVRRLCAARHQVCVWNRTYAKAEALAAAGASPQPSIAAAVDGSELVLTMLSDDAAVDAAVAQALPAAAPGTPFVDCTTVTPHGVEARATRVKAKGHPFLHCPVFASPDMVDRGEGVLLIGGARETYVALAGVLRAIIEHHEYLGAAPGRAAIFKTLGNQINGCLTAAVAEAADCARALGVASADLAKTFGALGFGAHVLTRLQRIADGTWEPVSFPLSMFQKDLRIFVESAHHAHVNVPVLTAALERANAALEIGLGDLDASAVADPRVAQRLA
ncbi:NAD(P)-dependent oxidoreductase [bacterium]|nr:MAG: NAD(P)-dependent oxidoreductase [bacterium]